MVRYRWVGVSGRIFMALVMLFSFACRVLRGVSGGMFWNCLFVICFLGVSDYDCKFIV